MRGQDSMRGSVSQDWRKALSGDKSRAYLGCMQTLETTYGMFSVNLDEAFGMKRRGRSSMACEILGVAPALCQRMAGPLQSLLSAMMDHAKHFGVAPNILPLDPENFQHSRSQQAARRSDLFVRVLLTRKSQFLYKMSTLSELVGELDEAFAASIEELCNESSVHPEKEWEVLDSVHYDLNTCLRHTVVMFKSFLHALPDVQLPEFEENLRARYAATPSTANRSRHLAHRRMAFLKGQ